MKNASFLLGFFLVFFILIQFQNTSDNINNNYYQINDYSDYSSDYSSDDSEIDEPVRSFVSRYNNRVPINVPTRGYPPQYQQMGILTDQNDPENIKPLYGRQTYPGSNKYNYFTKKDSHLAPSIPLSFEDKDCTKENGCKELNDNSQISLNHKNYNVKLYELNTPKYIPY